MGKIVEVDFPIDKIVVGKRHRSLRDVSGLAESISQIGLLSRIHILPSGKLVAGLHRLEACRLIGWKSIPVRVVEYDELEAELAEIDENLRRSDLTVLEQAEHFLRRVEILEAMGQRAKAGGQPGNGNASKNEGGTVIPSFQTTASIAAEMGLSESSAQKRLQIARDITPEVKKAIATPMSNAKDVTRRTEYGGTQIKESATR